MRPAIPGCRWTPALACDWSPAAMLAHCGPLAHSGQRELKTQGTPVAAHPGGFPVLVGWACVRSILAPTFISPYSPCSHGAFSLPGQPQPLVHHQVCGTQHGVWHPAGIRVIGRMIYWTETGFLQSRTPGRVQFEGKDTDTNLEQSIGLGLQFSPKPARKGSSSPLPCRERRLRETPGCLSFVVSVWYSQTSFRADLSPNLNLFPLYLTHTEFGVTKDCPSSSVGQAVWRVGIQASGPLVVAEPGGVNENTRGGRTWTGKCCLLHSWSNLQDSSSCDMGWAASTTCFQWVPRLAEQSFNGWGEIQGKISFSSFQKIAIWNLSRLTSHFENLMEAKNFLEKST